MKKIAALLLLLASAAPLPAAQYVIKSSATQDGPVNLSDGALDSVFDSAGNIYVTGYVQTGANGEDIWIAKYSPSMVFIASRTYDGGFGNNDRGQAMDYVFSGSTMIFVAGYVTNASNRDIYVARFDQNLNLISSTTYDSGGADEGKAVAFNSNQARVLVAGYRTPGGTGRDMFVAQFNPFSSLAFGVAFSTNAAGGTNNDGVEAIDDIDGTGDVYIVGTKQSAGNEIVLFELDSSLSMTDSTTYNNNMPQAFGAALSSDNSSLYVVGSNMTNQGILLKFSASSLVTAPSNQSIGNIPSAGRDVDLHSSGDILVTGYTQNTNQDVFIGRFSSSSLTQVSSGSYDSGAGADSGYGFRAGSSTGLVVAAQLAFNSNDAALLEFRETQAPNSPFFLEQYFVSSSTQVAHNGVSNSTGAIELRATVSDTDADFVKLQVEVRTSATNPFGSFSATHESGLIASGSTATVMVTGLLSGTSYWWRARTVDEHGAVSSSSEYFDGPSFGDSDFTTFDGVRKWNSFCCTFSSASIASNWIPAEIPKNGDGLYFPSGTQSATWDLPLVSLSTVTLGAGYNNVVTATTDMKLDGLVEIKGGTLRLTNNTAPINGNIVVYSSWSAGQGGTLEFSSNTGVMNGNLTLDGSFTNGYASVYLGSSNQIIAGDITLTSTGSQIYFDSGVHRFRGDLTKSANSFVGSGSGQIILDGTARQTITNPWPFYRLRVETSSDVVMADSFSGVGVTQELDIALGTFNAGTSSHTLSGNLLHTGGAVMLNAGSTWTLTNSNYQALASAVSWGTLDVQKFGGYSTVTFTGASIPSINRLVIESGGTGGLDISSGAAVRHIRIGGALVVDDSSRFITYGSTVEFNGSGAQSVSGVASTVPFGNVHVNKGGGTLSWDRPVAISGAVTHSAGTLNPSTGTHTVAGHWFHAAGAGTFAPSSGTIRFESFASTGPVYVSLASTATNHFNNVEITSLTVVAASALNIDGHLKVGRDGFCNESPNFDFNSFTVSVAGNLSLTEGGSLQGTGLLRMDGASPQTIGSITPDCGTPSYNFPSFEAAGSSVTLADGDNIYVNGFTVSQGTFTTSNSTISVSGNWLESGSGTFRPSSGRVLLGGTGAQSVVTRAGNYFYDLAVEGQTGSAVTVGSDFEVRNDLSLTALSGAPTFNFPNRKLTLQGDLSYAGGIGGTVTGSTVVFSGPLAQTVTGATQLGSLELSGAGIVTLPDNLTVENVFIQGGATLDGSNKNLNVGRSFSSSGSYSNANSTLTFTGSDAAFISSLSTLRNVIMAKTAANVALSTGMDVDGYLRLQSGTFAPGTYTVLLAGDFQGQGGDMTGSSSTFRFDGGGSSAINITAGTVNFGLLDVASGKTVTVSNGLQAKDILVNGGATFNPSGSYARLTGDLSVFGVIGGGRFQFNGNGPQNILTNTEPLTFAELEIGQGGSSPAVSASSSIVVTTEFELTTGTFTFTGSTFTVTNDMTWGGGAFTHPSGLFRFTGSGSALVSAGANVLFDDFTAGKDPGALLTFTGGSGLQVGGDFTVTGGTFAAGGGTHTVSGDFNSTAGTLLPATGEFVAGGSAVQTFSLSAGQSFPNFRVNKSGGSLTTPGGLTVDGDLTMQSGTYDISSSYVDLNGDYVANGGFLSLDTGSQFYFTGASAQNILGTSMPLLPEVNVSGAGTVFAQRNIQVNGVFYLNSGGFDAGNFNHQMAGWNQSGGAFTAQNSTITWAHPLAASPVNITALAGNPFRHFVVSHTTTVYALSGLDIDGDFTLQAGRFDPGSGLTHRLAGGYLQSAGTMTATSGEFVFDGASQPITISGGSNEFFHLVSSPTVSLIVLSPLSVKGDLSLHRGNASFAGTTLALSGNLNSFGGTLLAPNTLTFDGTGNQTVASSVVAFNDVTVNKGAGNLSFLGDPTMANLSIAAGALDGAGRNLTLTGDWTNADTFTASGSTVTFSGSAYQHVVSGGGSFAYLRVNKSTDTLELQTNVSVAADLTLDAGTLDLGGGSHQVAGLTNVNAGKLNMSSATLSASGGGYVQDPAELHMPASTPAPKLLLGGDLIVFGRFQSDAAANTISTVTASTYWEFTINMASVAIQGLTLESVRARITGFTGPFTMDNVRFRYQEPANASLMWDVATLPNLTQSGLDFDATVSTNVSVPFASGPGTLSLPGALGVSSGPAYEYDPFHRIFWATPAGPTGVNSTALSPAAISWNWTNPATDYEGVKVSSNSSGTDFLNTPSTASVSFAEVALSTNASYTRYVYSFNPFGESSRTSETRYTLASTPAAAGFSTVDYGSVTFSWNANGNPGGTSYTVQISTMAGFVPLWAASSVTANTSVLFGAGGHGPQLTANTTYYFQVAAENGDAIFTPYVGASTVTLPPGPPTGLTSGAINETSIAMSWNLVGGATGYTLVASTNSSGTPVWSSSQVAGEAFTSATTPGLASNTSYYMFVQSNFNGGSSAFSASSLVPTAAAAPSTAAFIGGDVGITTTTFRFTAPNPGPTLYEAEVADNGGFAPALSTNTQTLPSGASTAFFSGLAANKTHFYRVRAVNHGGVASAWSATAPQATLPSNPPTGQAVTAVAETSISASWTLAEGATGYTLSASTNVGGTPVWASSVTVGNGATSATLDTPPLARNTTYYLFVRSNYFAGSSADAVFPATATYAAAPTSLAFSAGEVHFTSATFSWNSNNDPAPTLFQAEVAANPGFSPALSTNSFSTSLASTQTTFTSLEANTFYYFRVRAVDHGGTPSAWSATQSTVTLAPPGPATASVTAVTETSVSASWSLVAGATGYTLKASTEAANPPLNVWASSVTVGNGATSATVDTPSLASNTTYYLFVQANFSGGSTAHTATGSTATLAVAPSTEAFSGGDVGVTSVTFRLSAPNPGPTLYQAEAADNAGFTPALATNTVTVPAGSTSTVFTGLAANTGYFFRVRAVNHGGTPSAWSATASATTQGAPAPTGPLIVAVAQTSIDASWTLAPGATGYTLTASTNAGGSPVWASATTAGGGSTSATVAAPALAVNTTYYLFVRSNFNLGFSADAPFPSTATLAAVPASQAFALGDVQLTSATFVWTSNNDPQLTKFEAEAADNAGFAPALATQTFSTSQASTQTTFTSLAANATYYFRVRAVNHGNTPSAWSATQSTMTLTPAAPAAVAPVAVYLSSITASWSLSTGATGYTLAASTNSGASPNPVAAFATTVGESSTTATLTGLLTNTTYFLYVKANYNAGSSAYAVSSATPTLADVPTAPTFNAGEVFFTSATFRFTAPNPGATLYEAEVADNPGFSPGLSTNTLTTVAASTGTQFTVLSANTQYYFRARAINHAGVPSAFSATASTTTMAPPGPTGFNLSAVSTGSIDMSWNLVGGATGYTMTASTNAGGTPVFASSITFGSGATSAVIGGLSANTTYYMFVRANFSGNSTADTAYGAVVTSAIQPGASAIAGIGESAFTAVWTNPGNPAGTLYVVERSTQPFPNALAGNVQVQTTLLTNTFSGLALETTYYAQVKAVNHAAVSTLQTQLGLAFTYDITAPTGAILEPNAVEEAASSLSVLSGTAADGGTGIAGVDVSLSNGTNGWNGASFSAGIPNYVAASFAAGSWSYAIATTAWTHGVTYQAVARPADVRGNVSFSTATFIVDAEAPNVITNLSALATGFPGQVQLTWTVPTEDSAGVLPPSSYEVRYASAPFIDDASYSSRSSATATNGGFLVGSTKNNVLVNGLTDGVAWFFHVKSVDNVGNISNVDTSGTGASTIPGDLTGPDAVTDLSAVSTGNPGEVQLTWSVPQEYGLYSVPIVFDVRYATFPISDANFPGLSNSLIINVDTTTAVVGSPVVRTMTGLVTGTPHFFAVRSNDIVPNFSLVSNMGFATPSNDGGAPATISTLSAAPGTNDGEVQLTWTVPNEDASNPASGAPQTYDVRYATTAFSTDPEFVVAPSAIFTNGSAAVGSLKSATLTGLVPGTTYYFRIKSTDDAGQPSLMDVTSPQASAPAKGTLAQSIFGSVVQAGGQPINLVVVEAMLAGSDAVVAVAVTDANGQWRITGLTPGANYKIRVSWTVGEITSSAFLDNIPAGTLNVQFQLDINIQLATIEGTVAVAGRAPTGAPYGAPAGAVQPAYIEIYQNGQKLATIYTDPEGRYVVPNLLPGNYAVRAYNGLAFSEMEEITLAEGQVLSLQFKFDLLPEEKVYFYPNPARSFVTVRFESLTQPLEAQALVFDLAGGLVKELPGPAATRSGAEVSWTWDLTNDRGEAVASGVYLVHVKVHDPATNRRQGVIKKLAVIK